MWRDFTGNKDETTNDPMEATFIGFRMWTQAVAQSGTTDVNAVKIDAAGKFDVIWQSLNPVSADAWSKYIPDSAKRTADWTFP